MSVTKSFYANKVILTHYPYPYPSELKPAHGTTALTSMVNVCYDFEEQVSDYWARKRSKHFLNVYYKCRATGLKDSPTWDIAVHEGATSWCYVESFMEAAGKYHKGHTIW